MDTQIDEFVAQQNQYLAKASQDHEQLMRDLESELPTRSVLFS